MNPRSLKERVTSTMKSLKVTLVQMEASPKRCGFTTSQLWSSSLTPSQKAGDSSEAKMSAASFVVTPSDYPAELVVMLVSC